MKRWLLLVLVGCSSTVHHAKVDAGGGGGDAAVAFPDAATGTVADSGAGTVADSGTATVADAAAATEADAAAATVADAAPVGPVHVHIYIANDCTTSTDPTDISAPSGSSVVLEFHNHSVDYQADVWNTTFNYGYLMLDTGATWTDDKAPVCQIHSTYTETFDIGASGVDTSVCPHATFTAHCGP